MWLPLTYNDVRLTKLKAYDIWPSTDFHALYKGMNQVTMSLILFQSWSVTFNDSGF
jgi:hypothetical protein